jgi:hypothetical protein
MASFLVFLAQGKGVPKDRLESEFASRGMTHVRSGQSGDVIEFAKTSDTLYLIMDGENVRRAELNPDYRARPRMHDRIYDALEALGYEHLDEDDPRIADE